MTRNIGIFAHVDAGKTTLTEQLLLQTGTIRKAGRVDDGTAHTDSLAIERRRGISIRSGSACVRHRGTEINIIDTPGHVDFSNEVETALLAVDGAVLVVSAVEGVQAQTAVICKVLRNLRLPCIVFVNKVDRAGADAERVVGELSRLLPMPVLMEGDLLDELTACDDILLEAALAGEVKREEIREAASRACRALAAVPVFSGSALKGLGVEAVLDAVVDFLPPPNDAGEFSAAAYHVRQEGDERKVHLRMFGGEISVGAVEGFGKIRRIRVQTPEGEKPANALHAGEIGVAVGLEGLRAGMWLGKQIKGRAEMAVPVLRAQVVPEHESGLPDLMAALEQMHDETANLFPAFEPRLRTVHIRTMGEIHQQVLEQTLLENHGIRAELLPPEVLYRETPAGVGVGSFDMFIDPWKARATFRVEPGALGSGVKFVSEAHVDYLSKKYQSSIEKAVFPALQEGLTGWPVTDVIVTLVEGEGSPLSWGGAASHFAPVVPLGLFAALQDAGTQMLEPMYRFEASVAESGLSTMLYALSLIRSQNEPIVYENGMAKISGIVPVGTSQQFAVKVNEISHGRGDWRVEFAGYYPAPEGVGTKIPRTTPDPCNQALFTDFISGRTTMLEG